MEMWLLMVRRWFLARRRLRVWVWGSDRVIASVVFGVFARLPVRTDRQWIRCWLALPGVVHRLCYYERWRRYREV